MDKNSKDSKNRKDKSQGQISEAGGAFNGSEAEVGGADAVPDKTTGTAADHSDQAASE